MVICIHKCFAIGAGPIQTVSKMAVPIFFMISGFFYCKNKSSNKKTINKNKLLKLYLFWSFVYAVASIIYNSLNGISISDYLNNMFSMQTIFKFIFLNYHPLIHVAWYLGAYLYSLIVIDFFYDKGLKRYLYILSPILVIIGIFVGTIAKYIFGINYSVAFSRNFIFVGIPFFTFGMQFYENKEKILIRKKITNIVLELVFVIFAFLEYLYLKNKYSIVYGDVLISSVFLAVNTFSLFLKFYNDKNQTKIESILAKLGEEYSAGVYYIHYIVRNILNVIIHDDFLGKVYATFAPLLIYLICIVLTFVYKKIIYKFSVPAL